MKKKLGVKMLRGLLIVSLICLTIAPFCLACSPKDNGSGIYTKKIDDIVKNGQSSYKIVRAKDANSAIQFASSELQSFIKQSTGATIDIVEDAGLSYDKNSKILSIGKTTILNTSGLKLDYSQIKDDGFFIKTQGKSMFIDANLDRGIIYGVYDFLEQIMGVKFLATDCTYTPKLTEVPLYKMDRISSPDCAYRCFNSAPLDVWGSSLFGEYDTAFSLRTRTNGAQSGTLSEYGGSLTNAMYKGINFGHNSFKWVDPQIYLKTNPEMFGVDSNGNALEVCLTNGITDDGKIDESMAVSSIKVALESFKKFIKDADSNVKYYMFGQNDNLSPCDCAKCKSASRKYRRSGVMVRFANILAESAQKWAKENAPDKEVNLVHFAYTYNELAPVDEDYNLLDPTCKPKDNVVVYLAPIYADYYFPYGDSRQPASIDEILKSWKAVHNRFFLWTYHNDFKNNFWYMPASKGISGTLKFLKGMGAESMFMQTANNCLQLEDKNMEAYIATKLLWDSSLDAEKLREEFIKYYYGSASYIVTQYYNDFDAHIENQVNNKGLRFTALGAATTGLAHHDVKYYPIEFMNTQMSLLNKAERKIKNDTTLTEAEREKITIRIRNLRLVPNYMILENYSAYYPGLNAAKTKYAKAFFNECDALGVAYYKEASNIGSLRDQYI